MKVLGGQYLGKQLLGVPTLMMSSVCVSEEILASFVGKQRENGALAMRQICAITLIWVNSDTMYKHLYQSKNFPTYAWNIPQNPLTKSI